MKFTLSWSGPCARHCGRGARSGVRVDAPGPEQRRAGQGRRSGRRRRAAVAGETVEPEWPSATWSRQSSRSRSRTTAPAPLTVHREQLRLRAPDGREVPTGRLVRHRSRSPSRAARRRPRMRFMTRSGLSCTAPMAARRRRGLDDRRRSRAGQRRRLHAVEGLSALDERCRRGGGERAPSPGRAPPARRREPSRLGAVGHAASRLVQRGGGRRGTGSQGRERSPSKPAAAVSARRTAEGARRSGSRTAASEPRRSASQIDDTDAVVAEGARPLRECERRISEGAVSRICCPRGSRRRRPPVRTNAMTCGQSHPLYQAAGDAGGNHVTV